ncbi:hypothetical protein C8J57DRAFT_1458382 [Mycena rebaudengoi]|nr:hypothetical protein C8J57DRAFT_1458382 [Mycena rebaudengoi]
MPPVWQVVTVAQNMRDTLKSGTENKRHIFNRFCGCAGCKTTKANIRQMFPGLRVLHRPEPDSASGMGSPEVSATGTFADCTEAGSLAKRLDRVQPPRERCRGLVRALGTTVETTPGLRATLVPEIRVPLGNWLSSSES